ncbi:MAG TPA: phosphonoacetaldehyde hydrolase, partial [Acinetobacter nosocomialis]|nr:phosphonoacetaldehyde hydrolase [Acinetobacter nosocomialis]
SADEQIVLKDKAYQKMNASGAHYVIDSVADLPNVLDDIERRLGQGERP